MYYKTLGKTVKIPDFKLIIRDFKKINCYKRRAIRAVLTPFRRLARSSHGHAYFSVNPVYTTEPFWNGYQRTVMDRVRTVQHPVYTVHEKQAQTVRF